MGVVWRVEMLGDGYIEREIWGGFLGSERRGGIMLYNGVSHGILFGAYDLLIVCSGRGFGRRGSIIGGVSGDGISSRK